MDRFSLGLLLCIILIACSNTEKENPKQHDLPNAEQQDTNTVQPLSVEEKILPKVEISRESLLAGFPETPDYFIENGIDVEIKRIDERSSPYKTYYGAEPVYVTGENFTIIYATDKSYEIKCIILEGETIFPFWNQFLNATRDDLIKSWGSPTMSGTSWLNKTDWWGIVFSYDRITNEIKEVRINEAP